MSFADMISVLDANEVVAVVTTRPDGKAVATPIWSVVVDGVPYLRSAYGADSHWYRNAISARPVAVVRGDGSLAEHDRGAALDLPREAVSVAHLDDDTELRRVDEELRRKYQGLRGLDEMLTPEARACTLRVDAEPRVAVG
jgi:hypothetical protein